MFRKVFKLRSTGERVVVVTDFGNMVQVESELGYNLQTVGKAELVKTGDLENIVEAKKSELIPKTKRRNYRDDRRNRDNDEYAYDIDRGFYNYW